MEALLFCVFAVKDCQDREGGFGGCRSRDCAAPAAPGREMLRHSVAAWRRFGTKPASGQCRVRYSQSRVNLTVVQCLIITFVSLSVTYVVILAWPCWTKLR